MHVFCMYTQFVYYKDFLLILMGHIFLLNFQHKILLTVQLHYVQKEDYFRLNTL
jgi:hypothetical protein